MLYYFERVKINENMNMKIQVVYNVQIQNLCEISTENFVQF